jgi:hypothetical protein
VKSLPIVLLITVCLAHGACLNTSSPRRGPAKPLFGPEPSAELILLVTPIRVKEFKTDSEVDAIDGSLGKSEMPSEVVLFRIERTIAGEFTKTRLAEPSALSQAMDAAKGMDILKIVTADFKRPEGEISQGWISVAVGDIQKTFGIASRENPGDVRYKLYLNRDASRSDSYILVKVLPAG